MFIYSESMFTYSTSNSEKCNENEIFHDICSLQLYALIHHGCMGYFMWTCSDKKRPYACKQTEHLFHMYLKLLWKSLMYIPFSGHKNSQVDTHGQTHTHMCTQKSQMTHFSISCHGHPAFPQLESTIQLLGSNYLPYNLPLTTRKKKMNLKFPLLLQSHILCL